MQAARNFFQRIAAGAGGGGGGGGSGRLGSLATAAAAMGGLAYGGYHSLFTVHAGHRAVMYNRIGGINEKVLNEGLHFRMPWFQRPIIYDVRTRPKLITSESGSKDLQMVQLSIRVLFRPAPESLAQIYRRLGTDYDERVLPSIVNEVAKAVVAKYNASELLTKRDLVSRDIRNALMNRALGFNIVLDDVAITHLAFSTQYTAAVEAKQVAQQDSQRARYVVEKALQEKRSIVVRAQGEAESAKLIGESIKKNPAFLQLRRIDAAREVAASISNSNTRMYLDADALLLNELGETQSAADRKRKQ